MPEHFRADQELKHIIKGVVQMLLKHLTVIGHLSVRSFSNFNFDLEIDFQKHKPVALRICFISCLFEFLKTE